MDRSQWLTRLLLWYGAGRTLVLPEVGPGSGQTTNDRPDPLRADCVYSVVFWYRSATSLLLNINSQKRKSWRASEIWKPLAHIQSLGDHYYAYESVLSKDAAWEPRSPGSLNIRRGWETTA